MEHGTLSEANKALIREIAREVVDEVLEYKLPIILDKIACDNNCKAKNYFDDDEQRYKLQNTIYKIEENEKNKKDSKINRTIWVRWFLGTSFFLFLVKEFFDKFFKMRE